MRVLVQRVSSACVTVDGDTVGAIGTGLVLLVGVGTEDDSAAVEYCAEKCANLRLFADDDGRMNRSLVDVSGAALVISQFTLYGDCTRGRRPSFNAAAGAGVARRLYDEFGDALALCGLEVARGVFGAHMCVELHNDGPVTVLVEYP